MISVGVGASSVGFRPISRIVGCAAVALFLQAGVNYANDYFDGVRGVDNTRRIGPRRLVASGALSPSSVATAAAVCLLVACAVGIWLVIESRSVVLAAIGASAVVAALAYSGGPRPYAELALGEAAVFVFFGPVAAWGTAWVAAKKIPSSALYSGVSVGLLAASVLAANNWRDLLSDAAAGKRTLATRLGPQKAPWVWRAATAAALLVHSIGIASGALPLTALAAFACVPPVLAGWRLSASPPEKSAKLLVLSVVVTVVYGATTGGTVALYRPSG
jgi:1,4-dihydroxy-2-naphthoate octaprenyltransferase